MDPEEKKILEAEEKFYREQMLPVKLVNEEEFIESNCGLKKDIVYDLYLCRRTQDDYHYDANWHSLLCCRSGQIQYCIVPEYANECRYGNGYKIFISGSKYLTALYVPENCEEISVDIYMLSKWQRKVCQYEFPINLCPEYTLKDLCKKAQELPVELPLKQVLENTRTQTVFNKQAEFVFDGIVYKRLTLCYPYMFLLDYNLTIALQFNSLTKIFVEYYWVMPPTPVTGVTRLFTGKYLIMDKENDSFRIV